jgi:hypothetical protein
MMFFDYFARKKGREVGHFSGFVRQTTHIPPFLRAKRAPTSSTLALYGGYSTLVALLPRSHKKTLRNALDFCAESAKIKRIPKVPFPQRGSKAANVAYLT